MSRTTWVALLGLLLLAVVATSAQAQRSLECQRVWAGPSDANDILDCLGNRDRIGYQWKYYVYPGFAALIFLFCLFGLTTIFICRCCGCCCCSCMDWVKPKREEDRIKARCWLWMWIIFAVLWACGVCVLIIYGADLMMKTANRTLDDIEGGPVDYFIDTKNTALELLTDYSVSPPSKPDVDTSAFDDVETQVRDKIRMVRDDYFKYFKIASIVSYCVGGVGVLLILFLVVFGCCRCGGCCPTLFSGLYFFFAIIFSLLAILFTFSIYVAGAACGEVTLQFKREPGLAQWYLVPWCESQFDFKGLRDDIEAQVTTASNDACRQLLDYCDNNEDYSISLSGSISTKVFMCGEGITAATDCSSLDKVVDVLLASYAKPILNNMLCVNTTGWEYQEKCTLEACSQRCQDYTTPDIKARTWTADVMKKAEYATNASMALSYIMPLLQCDFIIDKLASSIELEDPSEGFTFSLSSTETASHCSNLRVSTVMLGCGFFVGSLMFIIGIYVLHRGSWVWPPASEDGEDEDLRKTSSSKSS